MTLPLGKVPIEILKEDVFKYLGVKSEKVAVGPSVGFDGAVIDIGSNSLIASMDPITGALEQIGWLAVNINANDIATFGVKPSFVLPCILLPENSEENTLETICKQMDDAAKTLGITIIGGHSEVTQKLANPTVVGCAIGITERDKYVTAGGVQKGDKLILTKSAGIEGTAILASDKMEQLKKEIPQQVLDRAKGFFRQISIVKEALLAFRTGGVNAMHDPTEGGVLGGIHEMADASQVGVEIYEKNIRIRSETAKICRFFEIDPLKLISSGALLISVTPEFSDRVVKNLKQGEIPSSVIGRFTEDPNYRILRKEEGEIQTLPRSTSDHLWKAIADHK